MRKGEEARSDREALVSDFMMTFTKEETCFSLASELSGLTWAYVTDSKGIPDSHRESQRGGRCLLPSNQCTPCHCGKVRSIPHHSGEGTEVRPIITGEADA